MIPVDRLPWPMRNSSAERRLSGKVSLNQSGVESYIAVTLERLNFASRSLRDTTRSSPVSKVTASQKANSIQPSVHPSWRALSIVMSR